MGGIIQFFSTAEGPGSPTFPSPSSPLRVEAAFRRSSWVGKFNHHFRGRSGFRKAAESLLESWSSVFLP